MPKVIVKCRYYKSGSGKGLGGYMNYIATREGVENKRKSSIFIRASRGLNPVLPCSFWLLTAASDRSRRLTSLQVAGTSRISLVVFRKDHLKNNDSA